MRPCTLTATWYGEPPRLGHFLKSDRGRTAYEITALREVVPRSPAAGCRRFVLTCLRHAPGDVPAGATVHRWRWARR